MKVTNSESVVKCCITAKTIFISPPGIAMPPAGLCFTDVTYFFKWRPSHSTAAGWIATRYTQFKFLQIWKKSKQIASLIASNLASNLVIHPRILIFSVFKIARLSSLRMKRCSRSLHLTIDRSNDRVYAVRIPWHKEVQHCRWALAGVAALSPTFSKSLMVSVAVSKLGCSPLFSLSQS